MMPLMIFPRSIHIGSDLKKITAIGGGNEKRS